MMFLSKSGAKAKQTSATLSETILKQVKSTYPDLCQNSHDESRDILMNEKVNDLERIQCLIEQFSSLSEDLIAKRNMLLGNEKNELDIFCLSKPPPAFGLSLLRIPDESWSN